MKRPSFIFSLIFAAGMPALAHAQAFDDASDSFDIPEVDVIFKCHKDDDSMEGAAGGLAGKLAQSKERVYGALLYPSESRFAYVAAPYKISGPAFFEQDGIKIACVTVQSVKSLSDNDAVATDEAANEGESAPVAEAPATEPSAEPADETVADEAPAQETVASPVVTAPDFSGVRDSNDFLPLEPTATAEAEPLEAIDAQPAATDALDEPEMSEPAQVPAPAAEETVLAPIDMGQHDAPAADAPEAPAAETPAAEAPAIEAPVAEEPVLAPIDMGQHDAPAADAAEAPSVEAPAAEEPVLAPIDMGRHDAPAADAAEAPVAEAPQASEPNVTVPEAIFAPSASEPNSPMAEAPGAVASVEADTATTLPEVVETPAANEAQDTPVVIPESETPVVSAESAPVVEAPVAAEPAPAAPQASDSNNNLIVATPEVESTLAEANVEAPVANVANNSNDQLAPSGQVETQVIPTYLDPNGFDAAAPAQVSAPVSDEATSPSASEATVTTEAPQATETTEPSTAEVLNPNGATPAAISPTVVANDNDEAASSETVVPAADVDNAEELEDRREAALWAGLDD